MEQKGKFIEHKFSDIRDKIYIVGEYYSIVSMFPFQSQTYYQITSRKIICNEIEKNRNS
jgi:hypothetical protein